MNRHPAPLPLLAMAPDPVDPPGSIDLTVDDLVDGDGAPYPAIDVDDPATWPTAPPAPAP